ncbi:hypothetical protein [Ascidiimonas aurantiaca]|uniref:hypothetical protein n=1 Tax=Ascidiimonas aurantiaca TaxID=1685432 RepID=UPI0030EEEDC1
MKKTLVLATAILITATPVFANGPEIKKDIIEGDPETCETFAWAASHLAYAMTHDGFAAGATWYSVYNNCMAGSA